jgi:hypothetical protein
VTCAQRTRLTGPHRLAGRQHTVGDEGAAWTIHISRGSVSLSIRTTGPISTRCMEHLQVALDAVRDLAAVLDEEGDRGADT